MKKITIHQLLLWVVLLFMGNSLFAQQQVDFTLKYNTATSEYEVYGKATQSGSFSVGGGSQLTVMTPASYADVPITVTSVVGGPWADNTQMYNPIPSLGVDFHSITTNGTFPAFTFTANQEQLIYKFTLNGGCVAGVRLYRNAAEGALPRDPDSNVPGMAGNDFENYFAPVSTGNQEYRANYSNTGTTCAPAAAADLVTSIGQPATPFVAGSPSNVPVTVTNQGTAPATGPINTTITVPTGFTVPATFPTPAGTTCSTSGQTVSCTTTGPLSNTAPNSVVINVPMTPTAGTVGTSPQTTATTSTPDEPAANTPNNPATPMTPSTPVAGTPDLVTSIGQPATPFVVGSPSNVPVTVTNQGTAPATGPINTTITVPTGFTVPASFPTPAGTTCSTSGQIVTCSTAGPLNNTSPNSVVINVPMTPTAGTVGTSPQTSATTSAPNEPAANTPNNPATPMTPSTPVAGVPDLVTSIGQPATPFVAGSPSNVPVTVTNQGTAPATGPINTTITVPTGFTVPATFPTPAGTTCSTSGQTVSCTTTGPLNNTSPNSVVINVPMTPTAGTVGTSPQTSATTSAPNEPAANTPNNPATPMTPSTPVQAATAPDLVTTIGTVTPAMVAGQTSNLPVTVTNIGTAPTTGTITTTITLPAGFTTQTLFVTNGYTCSTSGQTVACFSNTPLSNVAGSNANLLQIPITPAASTVGTTPIFNATTSGGGEPAGNTGNNAAAPTTSGTVAPTPAPDLVTSIGQPATPFVAGSPSNVPVTVTNQGTAPATGPINTTITVPTGFTVPATFPTPAGTTCNTSGQTVTCSTAGPLNNTSPNSVVINVPMTPTASTVGTSPQTNATTSAPNEPAANTGNNAATPMIPSTPVAAAPAPNMVISIGQPSPNFVAGTPSNVPVTLTNIGTAPETGNVNSTITLPVGFSAPASFSPVAGTTCTTSGQVVSCITAGPVSNVAGSNSKTFNIPVTPAASTIGTTPTTTASVSSPNEPVANQGDNNATPMIPTQAVQAAPAPNVTIALSQPSPNFVVGTPSNVLVTISNTGTASENGNINTTIYLPTGFSTPASFSPVAGTNCTTTGQVVSCTTVGPLNFVSGSNTKSFNVAITPAASTVGTSPQTTASVFAPNEPASNQGNNTASMAPTTPVAAAPAPDLVTTIGQPSPALVAGTPSNVPVTVTNIGTAPTTGTITTTITLPTGISAPATFTSNGNTCNTVGQTVTCTNPGPISNITPSNNTVINVPVTAAPSTVGTNPGPFNASSSTPSESNTGNNAAAPMTPTQPVQAAAVVNVALNVKVFLQGAYDAATGLMRDDLRSKGFLPLQQPYSAMARTSYHTGTEVTSAAALATTGSNAIVDWVLVELRTGTTAATRVATRAALVQRDGDVVDIDGISPLTFANRAAGSYYVVVTHRNHLGVMSDVALPLSATPNTCDFTLAYDGFGTHAMKAIGNINALWAGNANHIGVTHRNTIFSGANNDPDAIKNNVLTTVANSALDFSYVPMGYHIGDTNLDGDVKYQGPTNDVDNLIFFNVLSHPANNTTSPLFLISEQH